MANRKLPILVLVIVAATLLGYAASIDLPAHKGGFFSDEATYYAMAYSLAFDGDIRYERHDLERVYDRGYQGGPSGLFLRRDAASGELFYAKAFAYSLAAAPLVRVLGDNGFLVLHALLLIGVLFAGQAYLARTLEPAVATFWVLAYFLGSIAFLYYFWLTPEIFNLSVGFFATFLWLYKERPAGWPDDAAWAPRGWLAGAWTDYAAAVLYGVAAYSKPPSTILLAPLLCWMLLRRRFAHGMVLGAAAAVTIVVLFGITDVTTGDWNYMGGDRRSFTTDYPLQYRDRPWESTGTPMITEVSEYQERFPRLGHLAADLAAYVWVGRNGGVLIYMLPAVLAALAWLGSRRRRWLSPYALLLGATALNALAYMTVIQANWIGGGGTIGSRYFIGLYYAPFFAIPAGVGLLAPVLVWTFWAVFLSPIVLSPFASSTNPARHTQSFPFTLLPAEMGMLNDLPFNTNPRARRVTLREGDDYDFYFLDDHTYLREGALGGFWVKSRARAEIVVRVPHPDATLVLELRNGPAENRVRASLDGETATAELMPDQRATLRLQSSGRFRYGDNYVYRFVIESEGGGVPMLHSDSSQDFRSLGVFVAPRIETD